MNTLTEQQMAEINGGTVSVLEYALTGYVVGMAIAGPIGAKKGMVIGAATGAITNLVIR
ncbi:MAG: Blp family class II bacteriocin [Verrucomicrobia bacterium]|nr:Blp family class II bacteriocin [Verrucomicrobiota bacterium]